MIDRSPVRSRQRSAPAPRYALTVGLRSTPRFVLTQLPEIEVINTGEPVYPIDWRNGRILEDEPIATGAVICSAAAPSLASCSTIPYFGLRMKMFPCGERARGALPAALLDGVGVRDAAQPAGGVPRRVPLAEPASTSCATAIEIRMERPVPVQVGGDLAGGLRDRLHVELADKPVRVVN